MRFVTINLLYSNVRLVFWSMASINKELHVKSTICWTCNKRAV